METKDRKKIIYLDDVYHSLITVKNKISKHYELYPVQTVEKMFEVLNKIEPALILLDINMPEVDGFETIKQIKDNSKYADIPVIFITAARDRESIKKGLSLGAVDFISKPATETEIVERVEYNLDPEKRSGDKAVVLAIDDDPSILNSINGLLSNKYTVYTVPGVPNDRMIKELIKKINPDLFLLDCNMPGLTGFDLVPIIKSTSTFEDTPIIFLTSDGTVDNVYVAMSTKANDFLVKPINKEMLFQKLELHLKDYMVWRHMRANKNR